MSFKNQIYTKLISQLFSLLIWQFQFKTFIFKETEFIAVTAYQNTTVSRARAPLIFPKLSSPRTNTSSFQIINLQLPYKNSTFVLSSRFTSSKSANYHRCFVHNCRLHTPSKHVFWVKFLCRPVFSRKPLSNYGMRILQSTKTI